MDNIKDLAIGIVATAPSPATTGTSLVLQSGQGLDMPTPPFKALGYPPGVMPTKYNAEIIRVTAVVGDTLTITRAQGVTSPTGKTIAAGWIISNNIFVGDIASISNITKEVPTGSINGSNTAFTTVRPYIGGTLQVFVNGLAQSGFITENSPSTGQFSLDVAPSTGDTVVVSYQYTLGLAGNADTVDGFNASSTPTAGTLMPLDSGAKVPIETLSSTIIGSNSTSTAVNSITTTFVTIISLTVTITAAMVASGRKLKLRGYCCQINSTVDTDRADLAIEEGGTFHTIVYNRTGTSANGWAAFAETRPLTMPSAGSHTFTMQVKRGIGSGTLAAYADASSPIWIEAEIK